MAAAVESLRKRTASAHQRLEGSALGRALRRGDIERRTWSELLRAVSVVVSTLDTAMLRNGSETTRRLLPEIPEWSRRLSADLEALAPSPTEANGDAHDAALDLAAEIRRRIGDRSPWILGCLYVLRGAHGGHLQVVDGIESTLELHRNQGTSYFRATEDDPDGWRRFLRRLEETVGPGDLDAATEGALETFRFFDRLFQALDDPGPRVSRVTALNPEAGDHPIVHVPEHLRIAIDAGDRCHRAFGYLVRRFGERGRRFARSDGAWTATLCDLPPATARAQIDWLARLLASRGIPTVCLEHHLLELFRMLQEAPAPSPDGVEQLASLARALAERRTAIADTASLGVLLETTFPPLDPRGAEVLVAAVLDQRSGTGPCADRVRQWLAETRDLAEREVAEARALLDRAEEACSR